MGIYIVILLLAIAVVVLAMRRKSQPEGLVLHVMMPQQERQSGIGPVIVGALLSAALIGAAFAIGSIWTAAPTGPAHTSTMPTVDAASHPSVLAGSATLVRATATPTPAPQASAAELNERGKELMRQGYYAQAESLFRQAVVADPGAYEPYDNLAFCLYEDGATAEAITRWRQALAINPDSPDANAGLGMALFVSGQQDEGRRLYQQAVALGGGYADEQWMRDVGLWSTRALADSRPLR